MAEGAGEVVGGREEQQQALWAVPGLSLSLINYAGSMLCIPNEELLVQFPLKKKLSEGDRLCS